MTPVRLTPRRGLGKTVQPGAMPTTMLRHVPLALAGLALLGLGLRVIAQDGRIEALQAEVEKLHGRVADAERAAEDGAARAYPVRSAPAGGAQPARTPAAALMPARPEPPRAVVTGDEIARVESAVLSLLEADRPELREKLRAVVQEQQETIEHQEQEQRRERWIARPEARLSALAGEGVTDAQRQALVQMMLASRDQIADVRRNADTTPEAYTAARATVKQLRQETAAKIREMLSPSQYEAFRRASGDDDDDDERGQRPPQR